MNTWSEGYRTDISYTFGYYRELSPAMLRFSLLTKRIRPPSFETDPSTYCELAFGQGVSLAVHSATTPGCDFYGTDFNPSHAAQALELHRAAGVDTQIFDDSFAEFSRRDLPQFDYICLHGIWSWISRENQLIVIDFVRKHLKLGGALYVSYNCMPGWATSMPLRRLLTTHAEFSSAEVAGPLRKAGEAIEFAEKLGALGGGYFGATPAATEQLKSIRGHDAAYVLHEYFNETWDPQYFVDVANDFANAKLSFATSANLLDSVDSIHFSKEARDFLASVQHTLLRETLRDYLVNQRFRRDVFVRGVRSLSADEQRSRLLEMRFALLRSRNQVPLKFRSVLGEVTMNAETYEPILDTLASEAYVPKRLSELVSSPALANLQFPELLTCVSILVGAGYVQPCQAESAQRDVVGATNALNRHLLRRAKYSGEVQVLASPVLGAGVPLTRLDQIFLLCRTEKEVDASGSAHAILESQGQLIIKDGKPLQTKEANLAEVRRLYELFERDQLPLLTALGITN